MPASDAAESKGPREAETSAQPDWNNLLSAGASRLSKLGTVLAADEKKPVEVAPGLRIETDKTTGQRHLKLPVPSKQVLGDLASLLNQLAEKL